MKTRTVKWMVVVSFLYVIFAVLGLVFFGISVEFTQMVYIIVLAAPLYIKKLANWLSLNLPWFN
jgi:hypothetical protein